VQSEELSPFNSQIHLLSLKALNSLLSQSRVTQFVNKLVRCQSERRVTYNSACNRRHQNFCQSSENVLIKLLVAMDRNARG
jgi:hypothetical protein